MPRPPAALPPSLIALARRQAGLVSLRQCVARGVPADRITRAARSGRLPRVARGVYDVGAGLPPSRADPQDVRRRRAAALGVLAHPGAVATGVCALVLRGVQGAPTVVQPEVAFPDGSSREAVTPVRVRRVPVRRWEVVGGLRCAEVADALAQAVPELDRRHAVALMDSALQQGFLTEAELAAAHDDARGRPGVERTHRWWGEADGRAESPAETWARLSCLRAGVPPDALQQVVVDADGGFLARVDLAWSLPDGRVLLVEIDGAEPHSSPRAVYRDRVRQNDLVTARSLVRRYTGTDAWHGAVGPAVRRLLEPTGWRPGRPAPRTVTV
ncbi:type IV toxin-antitoxin system AbiEi family antitoxin domain-containing protein [Isoptericola haloaureus]|uniref:Type IV toxin-antitoxin system AbiEi family antitoxin domain-containing protein n=1 Tax=Isoptericola haloaureus TaxID=1542902 RepID=A0ABU7Z9Q5_9MICO